ncbi:MAG: hypothetical protein ACTHOF_07760, partial [Flavisolibacter sp.]
FLFSILWNGLWIFKGKSEVMFPVWFFIVLILLICYLLYLTRTTEETLANMSKNHIRKFQYWMKELSGK